MDNASASALFSKRNIIQIKDYQFTSSDLPKDRYAIILEGPREGGKFLMATTSSSLILPDGCYFSNGKVKYQDSYACYHFFGGHCVCEHGVFSFPKDSSINLLRACSIFEKESSVLLNGRNLKKLCKLVYSCRIKAHDTPHGNRPV